MCRERPVSSAGMLQLSAKASIDSRRKVLLGDMHIRQLQVGCREAPLLQIPLCICEMPTICLQIKFSIDPATQMPTSPS